jgi:hypothetical protein
MCAASATTVRELMIRYAFCNGEQDKNSATRLTYSA